MTSNNQVKTQQGVPSQPSKLTAAEVGSTFIKLTWEQPDHAGENIISYELYWNDTYTATVNYTYNEDLFISIRTHALWLNFDG